MPVLLPPNDPHVGDIGTAFRGTAKRLNPATGLLELVDLSSPGTVVTWRFQKPDGTTYDRTATVTDGPNGEFEYISVAGDIDQHGPWRRQAHATIGGGGGDWRGNKIGYRVEDNIPDP